MKSDTKRLDELLARLVDETITGEEIAEMETILEADGEAQDRYIHYLGLHDDLRTRSFDSTGLGGRFNPVRWKKIGAVAAAVAVFALAVFLLRPGPEFARIVDYDGPVSWTAKRTDSGGGIETGLAIGDGTLEMAGGDSWVEVEFADGTRAQLSGIAMLEIEKDDGQKTLRLSGGSLSIDAAPQPPGRPLRVLTPTAEVEVLGTQFNLLDSPFATRLEVNEGLVKVKRLADGLTEEVMPDHEIVVALEADTEFTAHRRVEFTSAWESELTRDLLQGHQTGRDTVRARTHLWRGDKALGERLENPVLLHSVVLDPSARGRPQVKLQPGQRLLLKGRVREAGNLHIGFATNRWKSGFAGKFAKTQAVPASDFTVEIPLAEMKRTKKSFAESPVGQEMVYLWIQSVHKDIGLEIANVRLLP